MKRSLSLLLISLLLISCGGGDDPADPGDGGNNQDDPIPTTPGTPDGNPTTQSFGPAGGTLTSEDGLFSITVPAGALPSPSPASGASGGGTEITIQPITNTAWGGVGKAYRLLPDGLQFAVPVELNFALEDSLLWGSDTLFVDTARQDDEGVWGILKSRRIDWETRTLTCTTSHFSDYSMVEGLQIRPAATSISTSSQVNLKVRHCVMGGVPAADDLATWIITCSEEDDLVPPGTFINWSVNGITGGNATVGTVVKTAPNGSSARYTAPATAPDPNKVAVTVMAKGRRGSQLLVSNITIGATWYGTVTITQGTYSSVAEVIWTAVGRFQNLETYRPTGSVRYTPETDYGPVCDFVSMNPREGIIDPDIGVMFIDWNSSPAVAYGYGEMNTISETCFTCDGWTEPDCSSGPLPGWFAADSLAVNPAGDAIYWQATDNNATPPKTVTVDFKEGLPVLPFTAKR